MAHSSLCDFPTTCLHLLLDTDPALSDPTLARKLRSNREVALSGLEEVITKYAMKQGDTEEEERKKRQKANQNKEVRKRNRRHATSYD